MKSNELVNALREGDNDAFSFVFEKYYGPLVGYITTFTRNKEQSEDIVQQSFINLWHNRAQLSNETSPKQYLYSIAYNLQVDQYRKSVKKISLLEELRLENLRNRIEEDEDVLEKRLAKLKRAIEQLPPRCREILILSRQRGLEYLEIAEKLNISPRTVEEQIRIAFRKIRKSLEDQNFLLFILLKRIKRLGL